VKSFTHQSPVLPRKTPMEELKLKCVVLTICWICVGFSHATGTPHICCIMEFTVYWSACNFGMSCIWIVHLCEWQPNSTFMKISHSTCVLCSYPLPTTIFTWGRLPLRKSGTSYRTLEEEDLPDCYYVCFLKPFWLHFPPPPGVHSTCV
jgi:hypothetical protein